uniref:Uncharacterized protein n=1 Tax=Tetranychus urticae TaxID=32264 RepID=T1K888_TETUR
MSLQTSRRFRLKPSELKIQQTLVERSKNEKRQSHVENDFQLNRPSLDFVIYKPTEYNFNSKNIDDREKSKTKLCHYSYQAKLISWLTATIGLIWQIHQVSVIYFDFKTRVDIEIVPHQNITMPALTICTDLMAHPSILRYFPSFNLSKDARDYYRYLRPSKLLEFPAEPVKVDCRTPFPELIKIDPSGTDNCENFVAPRVSLHYNWETNRVIRCNTYYYQEPGKKPMEVIHGNAKDFYQVRLFSQGNHSFAIIVHNPIEILHVIEADTFHFWSQQTLSIILSTTKVITHLLPAPYRTDCVPYDDQEFGRLSCVYNCRIKQAIRDCPIWPKDVPVTKNTDLPFAVEGKVCWAPERHYCSQKFLCKAQCINHWYTTTLISVTEKRSNSNLTRLYVRRPSGAEFVYNYGPRLTQIEFICYTASCFGIWFGISVTDMLRFSLHYGTKRFVAHS